MDNVRECSTGTDKLNGKLPRTEEISLIVSDSTSILPAVSILTTKDSREDGNKDVDKNPVLTKPIQTSDRSMDGSRINEDKTDVDKSENLAEDPTDHNTSINFSDQRSVKTNLYDALGYIERTIGDQPEDEGDDSVFEICPSESDARKKPLGTSENAHVLHDPKLPEKSTSSD